MKAHRYHPARRGITATTFAAVISLMVSLISVPAAAQEVFVDQVDVDAFIYAADNVFWSSDCAGAGFPSGRVQRKPASGGPMHTVHDPVSCTTQTRVWSETVAADASAVYWVDAQGRVLKRSWSGTGEQQIATMEQLNLSSLARPRIAAGDQNIYWVEHTLNAVGEVILKSRVFWARKDGSLGRQLLFDLVPYYVRQIAAVGDVLYILTSDSTLRRGSNPFNLEVISAGAVQGFAVSAGATGSSGPGRVCWASVNFSTPLAEVWSAPLSNLNNKTRHYTVNQGWAIRALAVDDTDHVYWYEPRAPGGGPILKGPLGGSASVLVANVPFQRNLVSNGKYLFWKANDRRIDRIKTGANPVSVDLGAQSLEVIQAVQNSNNNVRLVADKATFVRLYSRILSASGGLSSITLAEPWGILRAYQVTNGVRGSELSYFGALGLGPYALASGPPAVKLTNPDRTKEEESVWFSLPEAWTKAGTIDLVATLNPARTIPETNHGNNEATLRVNFQSKEKLPISFVRGQYRLRNGTTTQYGDYLTGFPAMMDRALAVLPTSGFDVRWHPVKVGTKKAFNLFSGTAAAPLHKEEDRLNIKMGSLRSEYLSQNPGASQSTRFCAVTPMDGTSAGGKASGSACWWKYNLGPTNHEFNAPWGGMNMAHELGHTFDQKHINCGAPWGDVNYPYTNECWLSGPLKTGGSRDGIGWDPISATLIRHDQTRDLMGYGSPQWVSDYRWDGFFDKFLAGGSGAGPLPGGGPPPDGAGHLYFRGRIADAQAGGSAFLLSHPVRSPLLEQLQIEYDGPGDRTSWELRAYDEGDQLLTVVNPLVQPVSGTVPRRWLFLALMDSDPAIRRIELVATADPATVLARRSGGGNPPEVALLDPAGGVPVGDELEIRWEAADPDGDLLEHVVRYTNDDGATWQALETAYATTELIVETLFLPGGPDCRIQVEVSDGVLSAIAESEPFAVPLRPPDLRIAIASAGSGLCGSRSSNRFAVDDPVVLTGFAFDPEDGQLAGEQLNWSVTGPADYLATGDRLELYDLAPGTYSVSLSALDSDGMPAVAGETFYVAPKFVAASLSLPRLDGFLDDAAYQADQHPLRLRYDTGEMGTVVMVWAGDALYVGLTGMPVGNVSPRDWVGICLDPDDSGDEFAQADDYRFVVYADGEVRIDQGSGSGWVAMSGADGLEARVSRNAVCWSAELRIDGSWLGGRMQQVVGVRAGHYHRRFSGDDLNWPRESGWRSPWSWGDLVLGDDPGDGGGVPGCDPTEDSYEENDSRATAYDLSANGGLFLSAIDGTGQQADEDWYEITVTPGYERLLIDCSFTHADGDIDIQLTDASGVGLAVSQGVVDNESIEFTVPSTGAYFIRVYFGNAGNRYDLRWEEFSSLPDDNYEDNDTLATAYDLSGSAGVFLSAIAGPGVQYDEDWYEIAVPPGSAAVVIECEFSHANGDIDVQLTDPSGTVLAESIGTVDREFIDTTVPSAGAYFIRVHLANAGNAYELRWDLNAVQMEDVTVDEAAGVATLTAAIAVPLPSHLEVFYSTADDIARAGADYLAPGAVPLVIPAGQLFGTVEIPILEDAIAEANEAFFVHLTGTDGATPIDPSSATVTVTIIDNDDNDGDGMSNDWEILYGLNPDDPADAAIDLEGDQLESFLEFALGLDPTATYTEGLPVSAAGPLDLTLTYRKDTELTKLRYSVAFSTDFIMWTPVPDVLISTEGLIEIRRASVPKSEGGAARRLFLRLSVEVVE